MVRMRLVTEAYAYLLNQDPECALRESAFKRLVKQGVIPSIKVGNKTLVNLDVIDKFFAGEIVIPSPEPERVRGIRPINEKIVRLG